MIFTKLQQSETVTLKECYENHPKHHMRRKCQALLLNSEGHSIPNIAKIIKVKTRTIYEWLKKWEIEGIQGFQIKAGRGVKAKLDINDKETVELIKKSPH